MVITAPQNLDKRTVHVRDTWGRRCNKLLFFSSTWNTTIPTIGLNVSEGRNNLTPKYMHAYKYVIENHMEDADWFLKADDDTYVIMENLRYFLSFYNTDDPIFFGQIFQKFAKQGYPSGGSGHPSCPRYQLSLTLATTRMANMSDWAISFHYIGGPRMHEMEYFIYHLRPYGILPNFPAMAGSGGKK
nr:hypothetical protein BaRGS_007231 [Batillaria attramentaria]